MTTSKICVIVVMCYPIISGIIALFLIEEDKRKKELVNTVLKELKLR